MIRDIIEAAKGAIAQVEGERRQTDLVNQILKDEDMRAARKDDNQTAIVEAFRSAGASVAITSKMGDGFPDLVVGYRGGTYLVEVKDGDKPPSAQKLTRAQEKFHAAWKGYPVQVIKSVDIALGWIKSLR